jgi:hypothetical protein
MKKSLLILVAASLTLGSCVSKKKYTAIQLSNETLHGKLDEANRALERIAMPRRWPTCRPATTTCKRSGVAK